MKQLEPEFIGKGEVKGFVFKQLYGTPVYIYQVTNNGNTYYEIFEHKENKRFGAVSYPSSKAFGIWAYSTANLEKALQVRGMLIERVKSRNS